MNWRERWTVSWSSTLGFAVCDPEVEKLALLLPPRRSRLGRRGLTTAPPLMQQSASSEPSASLRRQRTGRPTSGARWSLFVTFQSGMEGMGVASGFSS